MNPLRKTLFVAATAGSLWLAAAVSPAMADPTSYQATGNVLAVTDTVVTIQKGKEKWDIARDASTKTEGDVKVGDKVTVHYTMTASAIDMSKAPAATAKDKKADKSAAAAAPAASPASSPAH